MHILPKKQINSQVASQAKAQLDEAIMLAKKIDALRQTLASLEKQHSDFADRVKDELHEQTKDLVREIEFRKKELSDLLEKRKKALEPLDMAWAEVKAKLKQVDATLDDIDSRNLRIMVEEEKAKKRAKEAKDSAYRVKVREKELERNYIASEDARIKSEKILESTEAECAKKIREINARLGAVGKLELELDSLKKINEDHRLRNEEKEKSLNDREKYINDKYATLERTIKRLSK